MNDDKIDISSDYEDGASSTTADPLPPSGPAFEDQMYGTNKPKRIVLRAKITHDKD